MHGGNVNVDLVVWPVREIPPPGAEHRVERVDVPLGGAAGVAGAALARLGQDPLVGCVENDALGAAAIEELRRYGVYAWHVRSIPGASTGASIAFEAPVAIGRS